MLDPSETTIHQVYTYIPNPYYWDKAVVHWQKIVIRVITNTTAELDAILSGSVDYMLGDEYTAATATQDGLQVATAPDFFAQVQIMDRDGKSVPALGNVKVREALEYALDRPTLAKALFGKYGQANDEITVPGWEGYSKSLENYYTYDVAKAKQLLAQAGYPHGFTLPVLAYNLQPGETTAAQAVAAEWGAIGVKVQLQEPATLATFEVNFADTHHPDMMFFYGVNPMYVDLQDWIHHAYADPYNVDDPTMYKLDDEASATTNAAQRDLIYQSITKRWLQLAWMIDFASFDKIVIARPGLEGVQMKAPYVDPNPVFMSAK